MEVSVHVQTGGTEVVSPGDVWDETFSPTPDLRQPHPHIPVPGLADHNEVVTKDTGLPTLSGVGHLGSSSWVKRLLLSIQPRPGMVSTL